MRNGMTRVLPSAWWSWLYLREFHCFSNLCRKVPHFENWVVQKWTVGPCYYTYSGVLQYETWHREHLIDDPVNNVGHKSHTILLNSMELRLHCYYSKGQSNWEWIYDVIVSSKCPSKDFCPIKQTRIVAKKLPKLTKKRATILVCLVGQKFLKFLIGILQETMSS